MNKKQNQLATPTEQRQEQERQTNEALLAEDAVQTTAYLANAPVLIFPFMLHRLITRERDRNDRSASDADPRCGRCRHP